MHQVPELPDCSWCIGCGGAQSHRAVKDCRLPGSCSSHLCQLWAVHSNHHKVHHTIWLPWFHRPARWCIVQSCWPVRGTAGQLHTDGIGRLRQRDRYAGPVHCRGHSGRYTRHARCVQSRHSHMRWCVGHICNESFRLCVLCTVLCLNGTPSMLGVVRH
jgi:hypothetical protein